VWGRRRPIGRTGPTVKPDPDQLVDQFVDQFAKSTHRRARQLEQALSAM
jgi:hypothetical protein